MIVLVIYWRRRSLLPPRRPENWSSLGLPCSPTSQSASVVRVPSWAFPEWL